MKYRNRILASGLLVAGLAAVLVFFAAQKVTRRGVTNRAVDRLRGEANMLAGVLAADASVLPSPLPSPPAAGASEQADRFADLAGKDLSLHVTVVAADGTVVGDSEVALEGLGRLESYLSRPEIEEAGRSGAGVSEGRGATAQDDLLCVARRVDRDGATVGYVRLSLPIREIERSVSGESLSLTGLSLLAMLAVAVIGYAGARRFSRPIELMSRAADGIAAGRRDLEVDYESDDEVGQLGAALKRMTAAMSAQIEALSAEKRLRDTMLEGMSEGLLVVDMQRHVLLCNNALTSLLALKGAPSSGRPLIQITRDPAVIDAFDATIHSGERQREIAHLNTDERGVFELTVSPLSDPSGTQTGAIGFFFDITRLAALESVRREFVADVSHELRTPLTSIKSFVETLLAGGIDDAANNRRFLEIIKKHTDRMEAIIDDLTDLSLIETGAVSLTLDRVVLASLARDLIESVRPGADARGISMVLDVPPGLTLRADRRRLEQVLLNLLDNGVKFNRRGGKVTLRGIELPGGAVRIEVEDTGIGIPADSMEKIFHRFYRVDRSRSRQMGGTGLGLSIVKHLMRLHGGMIQVESHLGEGTRFLLVFPAES